MATYINTILGLCELLHEIDLNFLGKTKIIISSGEVIAIINGHAFSKNDLKESFNNSIEKTWRSEGFKSKWIEDVQSLLLLITEYEREIKINNIFKEDIEEDQWI
jgi:hypothetical protein